MTHGVMSKCFLKLSITGAPKKSPHRPSLSSSLKNTFSVVICFIFLVNNVVLSVRQCGDLTCFVSPGVSKFNVRCRKGPSHSFVDRVKNGSRGFFYDPEMDSSAVLDSSNWRTLCKPVARRRLLVERRARDMGHVWDLKVSGFCRRSRSKSGNTRSTDSIQLLDATAGPKKKRLQNVIKVDVCIPASKTRFLTFDMKGDFAEQIMSLVYAAHVAQRLGFVLAIPKFIEERKSTDVTGARTSAHLRFKKRKRRLIPFGSLFDVRLLEKELASRANVQSRHGNPERPGLQHVRLDVPRYSDYVEYMDKLGGLAIAGDGLVVDVGDLFLRLNAPSCEVQDELASLLGVITSSFRNEIIDSASIIVKKLKTKGPTRRKSGNFNAVDPGFSSIPGSSTRVALAGTWKGRLGKSGFTKAVPVYVACAGKGTCVPDSFEHAGYSIFFESSFRDKLPRGLLQESGLKTAALDLLVLVQSSKFAGSTSSVFSHLVVTMRKGRASFELDENISKSFTKAADGAEHAHGTFSPRQPCRGSTDESIIATAADRGFPRDVINRRRSHLRNHGVRSSSFTDTLVALELFEQGKKRSAYKALQIATRSRTSDSREAKAQKLCSLVARNQRLLAFPLQLHLQISCSDSRRHARRPPRILFVSHNLYLQGAPLVMQFLIEYFVKVLRLHVDVLAPSDCCGIPLHDALLDLGVRRVMCRKKLDPRGYDAIYLNTIVSWFDLPNDPADRHFSWLDRTIWWVHESSREILQLFFKTPKLLPLVRTRIFVSEATRSVYADLGTSRDWTIYNALDAEDMFLNTTMASLKQRTRSTILRASSDETVFVLSGTISRERHQLDFVKAASKLMRDDPGAASLCRFVLIGFTGEYPDVEKAVIDIAAESALPEKFTFFKRKDHEAAVQLLAAADVLVSVSDKESFGMSVLEGMTAGMPAIVQKVDGLPEVVYEGAIDVDPRDIDSFVDAMRRMLDPSLRSAHGARAARRAAFFDKGAFYTKHVLALREALSMPNAVANL